MYRWRIFCVFIALMAFSGCTAKGVEPAESSQPPSTPPKGTQAITVNPWAQEILETPLPTVSPPPSNGNACSSSLLTDRSDAHFCIYQNALGEKAQAEFCISNPSAPEEYACLDRNLNWQILQGIPLRREQPSLPPKALDDYVYLKLTDGTTCWRTSKPGPPHIGDYVSLGFCSDNTDYWTRFITADAPTDASNPYGEGTDAEGRWLVKTGLEPGPLTTRAVETAYR
jgi:hypothetical protein